MEYTTNDLMERLGKLVNQVQRVRETVPAPMQVGDARHVALSRIQTVVAPLLLSVGALELANQTIADIDLRRVCGLKNHSNEELKRLFDTWLKLDLLVFGQFAFEGLFSDLLGALDPSYDQRRGFQRKVTDLLDRLGASSRADIQDLFMVMSLLRNSLHNNSINRNGNHDITLSGVRFQFEVEKPTQATVFDVIMLVERGVEFVDEILKLPAVTGLRSPIANRFEVELRAGHAP